LRCHVKLFGPAKDKAFLYLQFIPTWRNSVERSPKCVTTAALCGRFSDDDAEAVRTVPGSLERLSKAKRGL